MLVFISISVLFVLIYLLYPLFLTLLKPKGKKELYQSEIDTVSVILFSYNNKCYLSGKIEGLLNEVLCFKKHELIIIDNNSQDGSKEVLEILNNNDTIKVIYNNIHGLASSINLGVKISTYDYIIFCDLRQTLSKNSLINLVRPFSDPTVGAVSSCLSTIDSEGYFSIFRNHENRLKFKEGRIGSLMGVYGPLYAIKKECFETIPNHIILEDLYLSLKILESHKIIIKKECLITDRDFTKIYNYKRTKRYIKGLIQLLFEKGLIKHLSLSHKLMLIWHKYFRLLLPILILTSFFITLLVLIKYSVFFISLILIFTLFILFNNYVKCLSLIFIYYNLAIIEVTLLSGLKKVFSNIKIRLLK